MWMVAAYQHTNRLVKSQLAGYAATWHPYKTHNDLWHPVYIHQMNQVNSRNDFGRHDSTTKYYYYYH